MTMSEVEKVLRPYFAENIGAWNPIQCDEGWHELILDTHRQCLEADPNYRIDQIKEKFGELRYDVQGNRECQNIAFKASELSRHICERCGTTENVITKNILFTVYTLCEECHIVNSLMEEI